ncbi:esterase [Mycobacterium parmense]|uniref:Esterase n=1 Tax=Mycobacterium parmense TaxID=185642 RepID=A0A7I7Z2F0_9MYCO|nr:esterase [Mycobacterium parmense]
MTAPDKVSGSPRNALRPHDILRKRKAQARKFAISDGAPVEVLESGPSVAARVATVTSRLTIRPVLSVGSHVPNLPWPWGLIDLAARVLLPVSATVRETIALPHASAQLVRAPGGAARRRHPPGDSLPARRRVLDLRGQLARPAGRNPVEVRRLTHPGGQLSLAAQAFGGMALDDCHDAYRWLRERGYEPDQIVLAGDSAGGYLGLTLAQRLQEEGEEPAALVAISPLLQLAKEYKQAHPNIKTDAMFSAKAFDALGALVAGAAGKNVVDGKPEEIYEPLEHIKPGLPRTLIHVSGSEVLLHDAQLAATRLAAVGVPAEVRVWPGQVHDFQLAAPMLPEAIRSLRQIGDYIREATD